MPDDKNFSLSKEFNLKDEFPVPTYEEWKNKVIEDIKRASFERKLVTKTYEGIDLQPLYTKADIENLEFTHGYPGFPGSVRGTNASGYLGKGWDIAQEINFGDAEEFNSALLSDLQKGQNCINIQLDTATKLGLDSDYAKVDQVGDSGLSISGINSISRALQNIDLEKYPIYVHAGFSALPFLSILNAFLQKENIELSKIRGSIEADPVAFLVEKGKLPITLDFTFDKMKISLEWAKEKMPNIRTIGVSSYPYNRAGANAVQELAFAMAAAVEYINQLVERDVNVNDITRNFRFTFAVGSFYFMEIAKLRAAKILWSNILEEYDVEAENRKIVIHAKTSGFNQTIYDPFVNMLRTTTEAFSAVIGGVDSMHTNPFNERFSAPDQFSRRIARNTQIILNEESHLNQLIDPAGGSFYIEKLTSEVAGAAWKEFQKIEEMGGMIKALETGYPQQIISETYEKRKIDTAKRKSIIVGNNSYANIKDIKPRIKTGWSQEFYNKRSEYLQQYRVSGDSGNNKEVMDKLHELVENQSTSSIDIGAEAVLKGATIGEISHAVRARTNPSVEIKPLEFHFAAEIFEELRSAAENYKMIHGTLPKVFLANMGTLKQHKARADFSREFFEVGGFEIIYPEGFPDVETAGDAALKSGAQAVVICSTDDTYPGIVPGLIKMIKEKSKNLFVILAGFPKDQAEAYKEAGVDEFIFLGCNAYDVLSKLHKIISKAN